MREIKFLYYILTTPIKYVSRFFIVTNKVFAEALPPIKIPTHETLKDLIARAIPYWTENIAPVVRKRKRVFIVAHGTSLRGIVKHLETVDEESVQKLNLPTGIPFVYKLDHETLKPSVAPKYLEDENIVKEAVDKVLYMGLKS